MRTSQIQIVVYKIIGGAVSYLLLKRSEAKGGFWQPVTGGIELGENDIQALHRELGEELGIFTYIRVTPMIYEFSFSVEQSHNLKERVYGVEVDPDQEIILSSEHTDYAWLPYEDAIDRLKWDSNRQALTNLDLFIKPTILPKI
jgi:8-oxo-dGTP pyrophosphatase MutT (NUDIX family)